MFCFCSLESKHRLCISLKEELLIPETLCATTSFDPGKPKEAHMHFNCSLYISSSSLTDPTNKPDRQGSVYTCFVQTVSVSGRVERGLW